MTNKTSASQDSPLNWLRPTLLPAILALGVIVAAGLYIDQQSGVLTEQRMRSSAMDKLSLIRAKLEGNINGNIQLVRGLVSTISTEPDMDQERFSALVSNLFEERTQLRSVAAAPDLVVSATYPIAGNEKAIGLDYRLNDNQRDAALRARDTGRLVLAGPVDLVQGGRGFVGRFPVFVDQGSRRFWGVVSAVIDVERLYADSGLLDPDLPIEISITGKDATGGGGTRFYGPDLSNSNPVWANVVLPSGSWEIAAIPKDGWDSMQNSIWWQRLAMLAAGALILFPIIITSRLVAERQQHFRDLKQREAELARLSRRLGLALDTSKVGVWEMDIVSRELVWDDRMNELYGLPSDGGERGYLDWTTALHPEDLAKAEEDFARGLRTGRYYSEFRAVQKDGTVRSIRAIGAVYADAGASAKIVGVNWDVTADVALNEALKRAKLQTEARNSELEIARVRIEHNALHDSLTGLPNRRYLDDVLRRHAISGYLASGSVALLHMDLDRFKQINDTLGHAAGDAMLIHAATVLRANCGPDEFVARIGGDEFVVVLSAADGDAALASMAERIVRQMHRPVLYEGHECRFGVSIGIAVEEGADIDVKRLLINADIALYRAKARGRNRFEFFSEALQAEVVNTKRVADEILNGLERNEFVAHYQPQFDAHTLDLVGVEALVRWNHPTRGILAPDAFLAIAEELNVVATIDRLMLNQALADLRVWDEAGIEVPRVSVNVSLRRLHDEDLIAGLQLLGITPGRIAFELVESIYLDDGDAIVGWNIDQIKDLGIDVEIDDFGTGYASIVSLLKLNPKRLKIDRQFIAPIISELGQRRLLSSIIDIGKSMGIEVVAEGVETMEHARVLRDLGCDIVQGYAFARPMGAEALTNFIAEQKWRHASQA
ncbi:bifunctional diguanylate cyclase/phosphodiesterase [Devosia limi]|uniref:Diguanylate cyclase (GGDEF) domain-containing protein n=1 Tax=Devosia limi DSM 17137 TaxID=1121477 RepID=A0A1M5ATW3_9HYPH|nr:EAL domain-containing protein [Devosia limi]SHF33392.1 diguanylate cyclase (GGDEF) domain-containing protein [Devosia limi DSM 17137]